MVNMANEGCDLLIKKGGQQGKYGPKWLNMAK